jgi:hypothetical protein
MTLTTLIHLVLRLVSGAVPLLPHMSLWNRQGLYVLPFNTTEFLKWCSLNSLVPTVHNVALSKSGVCCPPVHFMWPASFLDILFFLFQGYLVTRHKSLN